MSDEDGVVVIRPNSDAQEKALASPADILIYGGAAGGGKSWFLRANALCALDDPFFNGIVFRRTTKQLRGGDSGSMWGDAKKMFRPFNPRANEQDLMLRFPSGASLRFWHIEHLKNLEDHQGPEYTYVGFDELTQFPEEMFWFLFGRLRSLGEWEPWIRGTCNPDSDSWVRGFLNWWIGEDGYPIPERDGVVRYFFRDGDDIRWIKDEELDDEGNPPLDEDGDPPISMTFVAAKLEDNATLNEMDPGYRRKLKAMPKVERERFLGGNWNVSHKEGLFENHNIQTISRALLPEGLDFLRYWDLADTEPKSNATANKKSRICATAGAKLAVTYEENPTGGPPIQCMYIFDVARKKLSGAKKQNWMRGVAVANDDPELVPQIIEQEPGGTGKEVLQTYKAIVFSGYRFFADRPSGDKAARAGRWVGIAEAGKVFLVLGDDDETPDWHATFLAELNKYPNNLQDQVDAVSGGYKMAINAKRPKKNKKRPRAHT